MFCVFRQSYSGQKRTDFTVRFRLKKVCVQPHVKSGSRWLPDLQLIQSTDADPSWTQNAVIQEALEVRLNVKNYQRYCN